MNLTPLIMALSGFSLIGVIVLAVLYWRQQMFFKHFTHDVAKADLKSALQHLNRQLEKLQQNHLDLKDQVGSIGQEIQTHFQQSGFIRFNPYSDTGGDQSFCFCLLDDYNNGIVITSLHSREQTRIYAKKVIQGKVEGNVFSKEEEQALKQALSKSTKK